MATAAPGILLDTNVLSELMRAQPDETVLAWFKQQKGIRFHTCAITQAEILLGIALLPRGKRKEGLLAAAEKMFVEDFGGHCLHFDGVAATEYALLVAVRSKAGKPITTEDAQIAAIAVCQGLTLATRNEKDFVLIQGLQVVNPWHSNDSH